MRPGGRFNADSDELHPAESQTPPPHPPSPPLPIQSASGCFPPARNRGIFPSTALLASDESFVEIPTYSAAPVANFQEQIHPLSFLPRNEDRSREQIDSSFVPRHAACPLKITGRCLRVSFSSN